MTNVQVESSSIYTACHISATPTTTNHPGFVAIANWVAFVPRKVLKPPFETENSSLDDVVHFGTTMLSEGHVDKYSIHWKKLYYWKVLLRFQ